MTSHGDDRSRIEEILSSVIAWAGSEVSIQAVALVGSVARGDATADSDVDLVVVTRDRTPFVDRDEWARALGGHVIATREWGALVERRVRLADGIELDIGLVGPEWAAQPIDAGTARVVRDGFRVLYDPASLLSTMTA